MQIPCELSRDGDRRKAGSREQVATLQDRVQFLESLIAQGRPSGATNNHELHVIDEDQRPADEACEEESILPHAFPNPSNSGYVPSEDGKHHVWPLPDRDTLPTSLPPIDRSHEPLRTVDVGGG